MSLARHEHLLADARESLIPDEAYEPTTIRCGERQSGCGATIPVDEAVLVNDIWYCLDCAPAARHYAALVEKCEGGRA